MKIKSFILAASAAIHIFSAEAQIGNANTIRIEPTDT